MTTEDLEEGSTAYHFREFLRLTGIESDRGSVLVAASELEDALTALLKARLLPSLDRDDELFDGAYSPFNTFSAKIDLACRVGCINPPVRKSCHILRKIRNDFAHATKIKNFDNPATQDRIRELFKINDELVSSLEKVIVEGTKEHPEKVTDFKDLILKFGWRFVLEMLFAAITAGLKDHLNNIEQIQVKGSYNKQSQPTAPQL
jgi:hypothetical protein